jgi:hypothetical protein
MSLIKDIDDKTLLDNVIRRNQTIDTLKDSLEGLKKNKEKLDGMTIDDCHTSAIYFLRARNEFIIKNIEEMIDFMEKGDWCLSVDSTKNREEEMDE